jgi:hypothetical protein
MENNEFFCNHKLELYKIKCYTNSFYRKTLMF